MKWEEQQTDAEIEVLSGLLCEGDKKNKNWIEAVEKLTIDCFLSFKNKIIFQAILNLHKKDQLVNIVTISEYLRLNDNLEKIGGRAYINDLAMCSLSTTVLQFHVSKLLKFRQLQVLKLLSAEIEQLVNNEASPDKIISFVDEELFKLQNVKPSKSFIALVSVIEEFSKEFEALCQSGGIDIKGVRTLNTTLNSYFEWFKNGDLIYLAARPSMGKTAFVLWLAVQIALQNKRVAFFSLEMGNRSLAERLFLAKTNIPRWKIKNPKFVKDEDWKSYWDKYEELSKLPLFIDDTSGLTIQDIKNRLLKLSKTEGKPDIVIIDYLQLIISDANKNNRNSEIEHISRILKTLAKTFDCPFICLSQLSREAEKRSDKRPVLSDLRDSGGIEQDADIVLMLYRDEYYNPDNTDAKNITEILIKKYREGETGVIKLKHDFTTMNYSDCEVYQ